MSPSGPQPCRCQEQARRLVTCARPVRISFGALDACNAPQNTSHLALTAGSKGRCKPPTAELSGSAHGQDQQLCLVAMGSEGLCLWQAKTPQ